MEPVDALGHGILAVLIFPIHEHTIAFYLFVSPMDIIFKSNVCLISPH